LPITWASIGLGARLFASRLDFTRIRNQNIQTISYNRITNEKLNEDYDMLPS